jgi:nucleoside-diphosphate-sugar epimerase
VRIAITGASGNVGTALLLRLGAHHEHEIVGVSRRTPPDVPPYSWVRWHAMDIADPDAQERLTTAFAGVDAVVHLAWAIQPTHDRSYLRRVNQDGTLAVAHAARAAGAAHLVHMSSIGTYAPAPGRWVDESWAATGVPSSSYSVDKAAVERALGGVEDDLTLTRVRPALILQDAAASEISRYFLGPFLPLAALRPGVVRRAPVPAGVQVQLVHADDVAQALATVVGRRAGGAFNVAAPTPIDRAVFAEVFGGVGPALPPRLLRSLTTLTWRLHLQPTDPGWLDLALGVPLLDTTAIQGLGWRARRSGAEVLAEFVAALRRGAGRPGPLLERRRRARPTPERMG